jgi:hypothetical protein
MKHEICDACETVSHCSAFGCIPLHPPAQKEPSEWQKVECPICGDMAIATDIPAPQRKPLTDEQFLELLLRTGSIELVTWATFVGGSIQMQGRIGLLRGAKLLKEFVETHYGITKGQK